MKVTYDEAMTQVFKDEGGYSNDRNDPGGPTNWGITIFDARKYWKADANANDVRKMPKEIAEVIYRKHYADPIGYDNLPAGVDYAVLDYAINSGTGRAIPVYNRVKTASPVATINAIYDERLRFLKSLRTWSTFGRGWATRCANGRRLALALNKKYPPSAAKPASAAVVAVGAVTAGASYWHPELWMYVVGGGVILSMLLCAVVVWYRKNANAV